MSEHKLCRPPNSAGKVLRAILGGRVVKRHTGDPMHAFITEDPADDTSLIVWVVDCACIGNLKCPRSRALLRASSMAYDSASVRPVRPGLAGPGRARANKQAKQGATMKTYKITITGLSDLLFHADNIEWSGQMQRWREDPANKAKSVRGDDRSPACTWIGSLYHDGKHVAIPSDNLMRCLMEGGAQVLVPGGKNGKTFKAQTQSGMLVVALFCSNSVDLDQEIHLNIAQ